MVDMAKLVLTTDTRGLKKGERGMDSLARKGEKTERRFKKSAAAMSSALNTLKISAVAMGAAVGVAAIAGFQSARGLDAALAEASTLLQGTTAEMSLMRKEARAMAGEFGGNSTQQVEAFYQAISAGAGSVEEASKLLRVSNQLAKGGVTDITTAVDVLTSATNAYTSMNLGAAAASDILFTGVKFGKTTVEELASTLGNVIPIASSVGIGFDEVVAATAALTTQGQSTSIAVTGIRGALSAVLKPTSEAATIAKELGIEFNTAGLKAKGFGGFIEDIIDKTDGSQDAIAKLFGSVEALNAVLAFTGGAGDAYAATMDGMAASAGATQLAADKVSASLSDRLDVSIGKVGLAAEWLGGILLSVAVPALEAVIKIVELVKSGFKSFASDMLGVFNFFTKEVVKTAQSTGTWTDAVDTHIQSEFDLQYALTEVTGENQEAAAAALVAANANLDAARAAYDRVDAEIALARAMVTRQSVEAGAARALADTGMNFFGEKQVEMMESDLNDGLQFLSTLESELVNRATGVRNAFVGVDKAVTYGQGGPNIWNPYRKAVDDVTDSVINLSDTITGAGGLKPAVETLADKMKTELISAVDGVANAFADWIGRGLRDFKSFAGSIISTFKNMLINMIAMAAKNKIMISLGLGGSAVGGVASAATGGGGLLSGMGATLIGGFGAAATGTTAAVAGTGLLGGLGAVGSGLMAGGIGGAAAATGTAVSAGMAAGGLAGAGMALGAIAPWLLVGFALFSIFKKKPPYKEKDFNAIQAAIELTNMELLNTNTAGQKAATALKKAFGGLENMQRATEGYYNSFFTNEEKRLRAIEGIDGVFASLGIAVPTTAASFRDIVEAQDLMTSEGQNTYAALLQVSDAFAQVYGGVNDVTNSLMSLNSAVGGSIFSTLVDERRAAAYQRNGIEFDVAQPDRAGGGIAYRGTGPRIQTKAETEEQRAAAVAAIESGNQTSLLIDIYKNTKRTFQINDSWDVEGLPPERT